ncbi:MAG: hypothetical protein CM15mP74_20020 [Halieaceae bacterium]|nr:MAG: hypothetical protein CM15mP74_20020 [Halieaceae bacterium]
MAWHDWCGEKDLDHRVEGIRETWLTGWRRACVGIEGGGDAGVSCYSRMPIYLAILFKVMKARGSRGLHRADRPLFRERLYGDGELDEAGRLRVDQLELDPEVQEEVAGIWEQIDTDNLKTLADFDGYRQEFLQLFGFGLMGWTTTQM